MIFYYSPTATLLYYLTFVYFDIKIYFFIKNEYRTKIEHHLKILGQGEEVPCFLSTQAP